MNTDLSHYDNSWYNPGKGGFIRIVWYFINVLFFINPLNPFSCIKVRLLRLFEGGNLAASKIRNLECPNYEICLIDYGCGKFNRKIHIMEQYP